METYEERLAAWDSELREKYTDSDRKDMAKAGQALPDGSYPIKDSEDLDNTIHAVGRGSNNSHNAIRKHIIARAKALGESGKIPDSWNVDGSLKDSEGKSQRNPALGKRRKQRHRSVPLMPEVRHFSATGVEVRTAEGSSDEVIVSGSAIVYDAPYLVRDFFGEFEERMMPGCVADILNQGVDCRMLLNHAGMPMARTTSGTLTLRDTSRALQIEARLDTRQQLAQDFVIAVERGDLNQMSVGMVVGLDEWDDNGTMETRDVYKLSDLSDVSGVTYPCSTTTNLEVAHRMFMEQPVESRARVRRLLLDVKATDLRAGKTLSGSNQDKVVEATKALHAVLATSGFDPADLIESDESGDGDAAGTLDEDATTGGGDGVEASGTDDGTGDGSGGLRQVDPGEPVRGDESPDGEVRDAPTPEDWGISQGLAGVKAHLASVKAQQLADPDNATDPDDKKVMKAITAAETAIDEAIVAQSKDGHEDEGRSMSALLRIRAEAQRLSKARQEFRIP